MDNQSGGSRSEPVAHYAPELNRLERRAKAFLEARTALRGEPPLTDADRAELSRIRTRAVLWAALSGTTSGLILGALEIYLRLGVIGDDDRGMLDDPWIWAGFYAFVGAVTVVEILFLYWIALKAISRTREVIGIAIDSQDAFDLVHTGLARGALEIPNPHVSIYGVDPYALMPRWRLLVWNLLYKAKVGVTSFALRILMRRVLARALLRSYIPLLAVPLYAIWNAVIIWRVMTEARLRALGPYAVTQIMSLAARPNATSEWHATVVHVVGEMIQRSGDAHPSYVLLLSQLVDQVGIEGNEVTVDYPQARDEVRRLSPDDRRRIIDIAMAVAVLAGRPRRSQIQLLIDLNETAGQEFDPTRLAERRLAVMNGRAPA